MRIQLTQATFKQHNNNGTIQKSYTATLSLPTLCQFTNKRLASWYWCSKSIVLDWISCQHYILVLNSVVLYSILQVLTSIFTHHDGWGWVLNELLTSNFWMNTPQSVVSFYNCPLSWLYVIPLTNSSQTTIRKSDSDQLMFYRHDTCTDNKNCFVSTIRLFLLIYSL